ncbi:MAG: glycosyltransferase [Acidobacteria bacterium]|nr:glycosyltransferase [Acidobacteriota bacterium]
MARPRALVLSPEAPYPLWGGGALRTASMLHSLAQRYELDVLLFREPAAGDPAAVLPPGLAVRTAVITLPHHARTVAARLGRNALRLLRAVPPLWDRFHGFDREVAEFVSGHSYDLAVVEHFWCAHYERILRPAARRVVLDLHNVESALHRRYGAVEGGALRWAHGRFARAYESLEAAWLPRFDLVLAPSLADAALLPAARTAVYPNTIPLYPAAAPYSTRPPVVVFSGNMEYHPNVQAVRWFGRDIWPLIRRARPEAEWLLVGKNEHAVRPLLAGARGVRFTGMVEDALGELARAAVAVVPLLSGSGTRLKILEAWAAGTPVVSTPLGAEGLGRAETLPLALASTPEEFAAAVLRLLDAPREAAALAAGGRKFYEESFTWESAGRVLTGLGM